MKPDRIVLILVFVNIFLLVLMPLSKQVSADEAKLDFVGNPTYELYKTNNAGYYYYVYTTIKNSASVSSCPINIRIYEDGRASVTNESSCLGVIFEPNEEKTFTIEWMTPYQEKQIEIRFIPSNIDNITKNNMGNTTFNVIYNSKSTSDDSTPGFSLLIIVLALIIIINMKKRN